MSEAVQQVLDQVWRAEAHRVVGGLTRVVRDLDAAEELAQEALLIALEAWPRVGVPKNPGAWLLTVARNRALNRLGRQRRLEVQHQQLANAMPTELSPDVLEAQLDDDVRDDVLRLLFAACHPVLSADARVALTLRLVAGLSVVEIARAYLVPEATLAQRLVRAKKTLSDAGVGFEVPSGDARAARLGSVLEVVYVLFNEGHTATEGGALLREELMREALRLGRLLTAVLPDVAEVHALLALMELQHSRSAARVDAQGDPVLLLEQDRARWDHEAIARGLTSLETAARLTDVYGVYRLQAELAAVHARARRPEDTDWARLEQLYAALYELNPSPVVALNHALALGQLQGPAALLTQLEGLAEALDGYHPFHAARGEALEALGRAHEARQAFERAAASTKNERQRARLLHRARLE